MDGGGWVVQLFPMVSYQDEVVRHPYKDALASRLLGAAVRAVCRRLLFRSLDLLPAAM
jgi:hypothetical protein